MMLTPTELERMTIFVVAEMARRRKARGLRLNHPEAHAYIADTLLEGAREGRSVADLAGWGATLLSSDDVMPGVAALLPIGSGRGSLSGWRQTHHGAPAHSTAWPWTSTGRGDDPGL